MRTPLNKQQAAVLIDHVKKAGLISVNANHQDRLPIDSGLFAVLKAEQIDIFSIDTYVTAQVSDKPVQPTK